MCHFGCIGLQPIMNGYSFYVGTKPPETGDCCKHNLKNISEHSYFKIVDCFIIGNSDNWQVIEQANHWDILTENYLQGRPRYHSEGQKLIGLARRIQRTYVVGERYRMRPTGLLLYLLFIEPRR